MAQGFKPLDQALDGAPAPRCDGNFVMIEYGFQTGWRLLAQYEGAAGVVCVIADNPVSYRVHDEREIVGYWTQRDQEGAAIAFCYEIAESAYLREMRDGVSAALQLELRHFLFVGNETCLEIIASEAPRLSATAPVRGGARPLH